MPEQRIWRPLPLAPSHGLPVLLVAVSTGPASYTIRVTDMANLWAEDLDRRAICERGRDENTSIDPSDTPENMAKFLSSLRSALDASQPGHDQTSLTLSPGASTEAAEDGLIVKVHCALPGIEPLRWPIHLKKAPPSALATDLVLPLMEGHYNRNLEVDLLIQSLNTKDAVIAKLVDKLEIMGTGLENVFTGLSGKRKVTRALAGEKIKGLAPFEENKWRASFDQRGDRPKDVNALLRGLSEIEGLRTQSALEVEASPDLDKWWHNVHRAASFSTLTHRDAISQGLRDASSKSREPGNSNGAFEDQPAPSPTRSGERKTAPAPGPGHDDDSTADEDDGVATTVTLSQRSRDSHTTHPARTGPMGKIGGWRAASTSQASASSASGSQQRRAPVVADDTETASDTDTGSVHDDGDASAPPPPRSSAPRGDGGGGGAAAAGGGDAPRKGGLGRIGGISARPQPPEAGGGGSPAKSPPRRKIGMIGRIGGATSTPTIAAAAAVAASVDGVGRGRDSIKRDEEMQAEKRASQARETSTERAERRREELKRELEKKASAGPVKKKRRF